MYLVTLLAYQLKSSCYMYIPDLLIQMEQRAREIMSSEKPWGGLNIILMGDLFQIKPPASGKTVIQCFIEQHCLEKFGIKDKKERSLIETKAAALFAAFIKQELSGNCRAQQDPEFADFIAQLRTIDPSAWPLKH